MVEHREVRVAAVSDANERHVDLAVGEDGGLGDIEGVAAAYSEKRSGACGTEELSAIRFHCCRL
jgi:hypothetical protein